MRSLGSLHEIFTEVLPADERCVSEKEVFYLVSQMVLILISCIGYYLWGRETAGAAPWLTEPPCLNKHSSAHCLTGTCHWMWGSMWWYNSPQGVCLSSRNRVQGQYTNTQGHATCRKRATFKNRHKWCLPLLGVVVVVVMKRHNGSLSARCTPSEVEEE